MLCVFFYSYSLEVDFFSLVTMKSKAICELKRQLEICLAYIFFYITSEKKMAQMKKAIFW